MPRSPRSINVPGLGHNAPIPLASRVGNVICTSAISGKDPSTGKLPEDAGTQAAHAFRNLRTALEAGGGGLADAVKITVYVKDNSARDAVNTEWLQCFPDPADRPARHIVVHDLQHGMWLQIECFAVIDSHQ
jgi:2-iminobutanoate/2-iminopropanoate deaminase